MTIDLSCRGLRVPVWPRKKASPAIRSRSDPRANGLDNGVAPGYGIVGGLALPGKLAEDDPTRPSGGDQLLAVVLLAAVLLAVLAVVLDPELAVEVVGG